MWKLFFGFAALTVGAQTLRYGNLTAEGPTARVDGTIAYDQTSRMIYLFGGQDTATRNDLWAYSLDRRSWTEVQVSGDKPAPRFGHTLVIDARRRLILFGGQASGFFSDIWAFDIERGRWQELAPADSGPSRRYGHSAIYDSRRDRVIVSHGFTNSGRFDDTWAFELGTNRWQNITPSGTRPIRRCLHRAVYNENADEMLLYGGCASGFGPCPLADLWSLDLRTNRWTERTVSVRPAAREQYGLTFDSRRGRLILFGGSGGGLLNDTWAFDGSSWQQLQIGGDAPGPRERHEATYASDVGASFFFGGSTGSGTSNELWMLAAPGSTAPQITAVTNAFSGVAGAVSPGQLVSVFGSGLGPAEGVALDGLLSGPGVSVRMNGVAASLLYVRSDQINAQAPAEMTGPDVEVAVVVNGASSSVSVPLRTASPGLFPRVFDGGPGVVALYATGLGSPVLPVSVRIGGRDAAVESMTTVSPGVHEIRVRVPAGLTSGLVVLRAGDLESQGVPLPGPGVE